jgi:transposase-like protein
MERDARNPIYRGRRFSSEIIELCVRWYITYRLSYRDLVAMMAERGIVVSHTAIMRWVLRYVPEYERKWARFARSPGSSWRMDETAVAVRGGRHDLYRAVDRAGKSVASLLCSDRCMESAQASFRAAVSQEAVPWPEKINVDGNSAPHRGLRLLATEDRRWQNVEVRARHYLNNVVERDHRAIKQRCAPMLGLKSFRSAAITLAGVELAHRVRKQQYSLPKGMKGRAGSLKEWWDAALADSGVPICRDGDRPTPMHQSSADHFQPARGRTPRGAGALSTKNLVWRKPLPARQAPRQAVLALPLPIRRQAEDAFTWDLSGRPDRRGAVAPSRGAAVACGGRRSVAHAARTAASRERGA